MPVVDLLVVYITLFSALSKWVRLSDEDEQG